MANANSLSLAAPMITQFVANYAQGAPADNGGSSVDTNTRYRQALAQLNNAFRPLLGKESEDSQTSLAVAPNPTPYSTDGIPQEIQSDPMSQLSSDDVSRMQKFSSQNTMMLRTYDDGGEGTVGGNGGTGSAPYDPGNGDVVVRDHRHPEPTDPVIWTSAPPAAAPSGSAGDVFTSGADFDRLDQANSDFQAAKQAALDDPTNPAKQAAFQDAAQALQLLANMLMQMSSMFASIADNAIKSSKVQAS
jgi:hypothetical protein